MRKALLVSEVPLTDESSRGADFAVRADRLEALGWTTIVGEVPPPYGLTFLPSLLRCLVIARRENVDLITSVSNPFHLQLIGFLVSTLTGLPWVAEIRDPMVENPDRDPGAPTTMLAAVVEWLVVHFADIVVWGNGIQMADDYFESTYDVDPAKIRKLPFKGFRHDVFDAADPVDYDEFTVTYAGSFYEGWLEPYTFIEGIEHYVTEYNRSLTVQFYGDWRPEYAEAVTTAGLENVIEHHEFVPKSEIIPFLKGSDVLVYIGGSDPANRLNVPSKMYDYMGARKPILAVVDPSFRIADLIKEEELGVVAPYDDPPAIADALHALRINSEFNPSEEVYARFARQRKIESLTKAYMDALENASADGGDVG